MLSRAGHESEHVETLETNFSMSKPRLMKKMKGTKKTRGIRQIHLLLRRIQMMLLISQTVQKLMTGGTESWTGSGKERSRWTRRNRPSY